MPIYGYCCENCAYEFEIQQKIKDKSKKKCPKCGKLKLRKKFYPIGLHFKGKGFYTTDHGIGHSPKKLPKEKDVIDGGKKPADVIKRKE